jgi:hypothetical protein
MDIWGFGLGEELKYLVWVTVAFWLLDTCISFNELSCSYGLLDSDKREYDSSVIIHGDSPAPTTSDESH